eukprot:CAMPEP_0181294304 /NCGR_PEP_ID=MMETSP1101-20121128/3524_1 /TAXON_ID=46948 /ORGANISM="Rhodomonas abbreviata, Strain Caron Lab Isolate" /LENGTH=179 /DNA_ID=CAMNT_0023398943 /DNA_START=87 /DNA_END=623 /DNA_ORIENTATION=-
MSLAALAAKRKALPLPKEALDVQEFRPSQEEFEDFWNYVASLNAIGRSSGCIKVVPPEGWQARSTYEGADPLVRSCGSQTVQGDCGIYELEIEDGGSIFLSDLCALITDSETESESQLSSDVKTAEKEFWRTMGMGGEVVYTGHTQFSTLFNAAAKTWNLGEMGGSSRTNLPKSSWATG